MILYNLEQYNADLEIHVIASHSEINQQIANYEKLIDLHWKI